LVLLVSTALLVRGVQTVRRVDPGFGKAPTAVLAVTFPINRYAPDQRVTAIRAVARRFQQLSGVVSVGVIDNIHLNLMNTQTTGVRNPDDNSAADRGFRDADRASVDTGFFAAAGIEIVRGRDFQAQEGGPGARVAIVNEALAARLWPGQNPIGRHLQQDGLVEVVGLVRTAKIRNLGEAPRPVLYTPLSGGRPASVWYLVRTAGDADRTAVAALAALRAFDRDLIPTTMTTTEQHIGTTMMPLRLGAMLLSALAAVATVLAMVGLYGTVSYAVAQRTREVGVRLALGADGRSVVRLLAGDGLKLVVWGAGIGLLLAGGVAVILGRVLAGAGFDVVTFLAVALGLGLVVGLAAWFPAMRAARVSPVAALRHEG
jgi:predicted permease